MGLGNTRRMLLYFYSIVYFKLFSFIVMNKNINGKLNEFIGR